MSHTEPYVLAIKEVSFFRVSEEVIAADVEALAARIAEADAWIAPISVERSTGIIMDGNHRWHAGVRLGLTHLPCVLLDYADPRVTVYQWEVDSPFPVADIFKVVMNREIFPYKTTRHLFAPALPRTEIALAELIMPLQKSA